MIQGNSSRSIGNIAMNPLDDQIKNYIFLWENDRMIFFFRQIWLSQSPTKRKYYCSL